MKNISEKGIFSRGGRPGKNLRVLREMMRLRMQQLMVFRLDFFLPSL